MNIVLTGGGTMGHITPAIAIIDALKNANNNFFYFGNENSLEEKTIIEYKNVKFIKMNVIPINRKNPFKNISVIKNIVKEKKRVLNEFMKIKPSLVIGTGGYVSFIPLLLAKKLKIPYVIHEQNSIAGIVNVLLEKKASLILLSYKESSLYFKNKNVIVSGNPSGDLAIKAKEKLDFLNPNYKRVLIVGGSNGSKSITEAFKEAFNSFKKERIQIVFVSGLRYYQELSLYKANNIYIFDYLERLNLMMHQFDLIVSRAGATTISEILALEIPSILIPSPNVTANHQYNNAKIIKEKKACIMIDDDMLNGKILYLQVMDALKSDFFLENMKNNIKKIKQNNSSLIIKSEIEKIIGG